MDDINTLVNLSRQMDLEQDGDSECPVKVQSDLREIHVQAAVLPNGKRIRLLKSLLSSVCENDCFYCPFRAGRDIARFTLKSETYAQLFMNVYRAGIVEGLFVSSGVFRGGVNIQNKLLDVAEILRNRYGFRGYIHMKIMPGAEYGQVEKAMQLSDRISVNLEAPTPETLARIAPHKHLSKDILDPLRWVEEIRRNRPAVLGWNRRWPSSTTQFVLGGSGESDAELLNVTADLFKNYGLKRAYYSPFRPVPGTPLEHHPAGLKVREQRLYQASFLLRDYGFKLDEIRLEKDGNLRLDKDPKAAWAEEVLGQQPLEINHASLEELMRVPGIGRCGAEAILQARRIHAIRNMSALHRLGIQAERVAPYVLLDGRRPAQQLSFW